jgi:hypothetical protein
MSGNMTQQAVVVSQTSLRSNQDVVQLALFKADGTAHVVPERAAAQTDVGAVTSTVAAGANPTKAEFDALRVDALATRTVLNALLAKMRTANQLAP